MIGTTFSLCTIVVVATTVTMLLMLMTTTAVVEAFTLEQRRQCRKRTTPQNPGGLQEPPQYQGIGSTTGFASTTDEETTTGSTVTRMMPATLPIPTMIPTVDSVINLNNQYAWDDLMMIEDLQEQHVQLQQAESVLTRTTSLTASSSSSAASTREGVDDYTQLHDDLTRINIRLFRSKLSPFLRIVLSQETTKQMVDRFVDFLINFIL